MNELENLPLFLREVSQKLRKGQREFGDAAFDQHPMELLRELKAECVDMAGWGFILYRRLCRIEEAFSGVVWQSIEQDLADEEYGTEVSDG